MISSSKTYEKMKKDFLKVSVFFLMDMVMSYTDQYDDLEETLRQFDMDMHYGPCLGLKRLERWERAHRMGMQPPIQVKEIIERVSGAPTCVWEGRV